MKAGLFYVVLFAFVLLVVPMLALGFDLTQPAELPVDAPKLPEQTEPAGQPVEPSSEAVQEEKAASAEEEVTAVQPLDNVQSSRYGVDSFRVLNESTGEVEEIALRDFIRGAVAAEMPASFHSEALKAQAVAAHTYALHNHLIQQEIPDPALNGADFSADPQNRIVYMTEEQARAFYGDSADQSWEKICAAADSVLDYVMEYDNQPIVAAYHAISAGQTEDASNVWTGSAPYLLPAESGGDLLAPDYETGESFAAEELRTLLQAAYPEIALAEDPAAWFGEEDRSGSGYVNMIQVGDQSLHGLDVRQLLGLRSHNFEIAYDGEAFRFQVYGYGHGVGLSQYGADYLARQGYTFDEILNHYYTDVTLCSIR